MADDSQPPAIITLTTDFGDGSRYVAAMKGVILSINPHASDRRYLARRSAARHSRRRDRAGRDGPLVSAGHDSCRGRRSRRRQQAADRLRPIGSQQFIAPDNGLLSRLACIDRAV